MSLESIENPDNIENPEENIKNPEENIENPEENIENPDNIENHKENIKNPEENIENPENDKNDKNDDSKMDMDEVIDPRSMLSLGIKEDTERKHQVSGY